MGPDGLNQARDVVPHRKPLDQQVTTALGVAGNIRQHLARRVDGAPGGHPERQLAVAALEELAEARQRLLVAEQGVVAVGADSWAVEAVPHEDPALVFPVHVELLARNGIYLLETDLIQRLATDFGIESFDDLLSFLALMRYRRGGTSLAERVAAFLEWAVGTEQPGFAVVGGQDDQAVVAEHAEIVEPIEDSDRPFPESFLKQAIQREKTLNHIIYPLTG